MDQPPKKIYPSRMPGRVHPCTAKGMKRIELWFDADRKQKVIRYCFMKGVTMSHLFRRLVMEEVNRNYDTLLSRYKRERLQKRGKAYRYLLNRQSKPAQINAR